MKLSFPIFHLKRQAKLLARQESIPLHLALDKIAHSEGFRSWSHLSANQSQDPSAKAFLAVCQPGEVVLLAARPGHGKTQLALDVLAEAAHTGRAVFFFTLEFYQSEADKLLRARKVDGITLDTSDEICADHIIAVMKAAPAGSVAAIDYLQLLDQKRQHPPIFDQLHTLNAFAKTQGVTFIALSQIDRTFDANETALPSFGDIRLPNPADLSLVSRACFLHNGQARLETPSHPNTPAPVN